MARKNYTKNYITTHVSTLNDHTGEIAEISRITTNMNYTGSFTLDINYLSTIKFMLLFSMIILFGSFALVGGFDEIFYKNSINETIEVVDGYGYDIFYTYYNWSGKFQILSDLRNIFDVQDLIDFTQLINSQNVYLVGDLFYKLDYYLNLLSIPFQIIGNLLLDIVVIFRFIFTW